MPSGVDHESPSRLPSYATSVEILDLPSIFKDKPLDLTRLGIDIPIGLLDGQGACDRAARELLGGYSSNPD